MPAAAATAIDSHLDQLWEECRAAKTHRVEDMHESVCRRTDEDLRYAKRAVKEALNEKRPDMSRKLQTAIAMQEEFAAGVQTWQEQSRVAVDDMKADQQRLHREVADAANRLGAAKEAMVAAHRRRAEEVEQEILHLLAQCRKTVVADAA